MDEPCTVIFDREEVPYLFILFLSVTIRNSVRSPLSLRLLIIHFSDLYSLRLPLYLLGKFGSTVAFTVCYIISSELFPTPLRHSLIGACSMFGRLGSMTAPQMPLLVR